MPLERKILLTIFLSLLFLLSGYLVYDYYSTKFKEIDNKISQYKILINKSSSVKSDISDNAIKKIEDLITYHKVRFFTEKESLVVNTTPVIKKMLIESGIKISQYKGNLESVSFSISGNKSNLLDFLYKLNRDNKYYNFPLFNLRMIDNRRFQANIEVSRPMLIDKKNDQFFIENIGSKLETTPLDYSILNPLGISFYTPNKVVVELKKEAIEPVQIEILPKPLFKFNYVGVLKKDNELITIFTESENGRVFKFKKGQTLSGWTYLGKIKNNFQFKNSDILYEVVP